MKRLELRWSMFILSIFNCNMLFNLLQIYTKPAYILSLSIFQAIYFKWFFFFFCLPFAGCSFGWCNSLFCSKRHRECRRVEAKLELGLEAIVVLKIQRRAEENDMQCFVLVSFLAWRISVQSFCHCFFRWAPLQSRNLVFTKGIISFLLIPGCIQETC